MKKLLAFVLAIILLLCACAAEEIPEPVLPEEPALTEPEEEKEPVPTEPEISFPKELKDEEKFAERIYNSEEHGLYMEALSGRINRHKDGTFEETPNHHSAYPEDFPSAENLLPPDETNTVLAWRNTIQMSETSWIDGAVDYIYLIDAYHAIVLEPVSLGMSDGTVSYGFGNSGYIDAEKAGFENICEWINKIYTDYYSTAKINFMLELAPEKGTPLSQKEIDKAAKAFETFYEEDGIVYWNISSMFVQGYYDRPEEMNAAAFLYYFPSRILITDEAEYDDLKELWASRGINIREGAKIKDHPVPLHKIPKEMVNEALEKYMGITVEDLMNSDLDTLAENGVDYMEKYDCFYSEASDSIGNGFVCTSGEKFSDGTVVLYSENVEVLVFKEHPDGSYKIYAHKRLYD